MSKLPVISGIECVAILEKVGFQVDRQRGSHIVLLQQISKQMIVVPNHKELDRGTLRAIIRQVGLTVDEFLQLL